MDKNFEKGLTDVEEKPFGVILFDIEIVANPNEVSSATLIEYIFINTSLQDVGTESGKVMVRYVTEIGDVYEPISHTVTFDTYESVGGVISGTFSATVRSIIPNGLDREITEGEFRVRRIADGTAWQPD